MIYRFFQPWPDSVVPVTVREGDPPTEISFDIVEVRAATEVDALTILRAFGYAVSYEGIERLRERATA